MVKHAVEANFDGLVGPTHNYAGLSWGNVASKSNVSSVSNPKEAALQGLAKMKRLADRGYVQGVLPPHERPHIPDFGPWGSKVRTLAFSSRRPNPVHRSWRQSLLRRRCGRPMRPRYRRVPIPLTIACISLRPT